MTQAVISLHETEELIMDENNTINKEPTCIPYFAHENSMMHYNAANKRMLIALIAVCITFILTIIIFVVGYTVRERNWLRTISGITAQTTEVQNDGVHQQPD